MSHQSQAVEALAAAAANAAAAERAARNINRLRRDPIHLDKMITALIHMHEITGHLAKIVTRYTDAVRSPVAGYSGSGGDSREAYPASVQDAAANAEQALAALAKKLGYAAPVSFSTDAIASLDIAVADWRTRRK
ncbi:hypothetical protein [Kibdelosporangium aridum]|uniref:hypothetical protein n=1 Tax=Kibdelosporangium aridum TaxID=2030 RepID=UPI0035E63FFC